MRRTLYVIGILPVFLFLWISLNYEKPSFEAFDKKISSFFFGNDGFILFHYFGETTFVMIVTILLLIYFWLRERNYRAMLFILMSIAGGTVINQALKSYYARPRPEILDQLNSYSFPSGHSMLGIIYLFTVAYLFSGISSSTKKSIVYWLIAIVLFVLIGISRVAEGRHFATDVLGGWSLGVTWFTLCVIWYETIKRRFAKMKRQ